MSSTPSSPGDGRRFAGRVAVVSGASSIPGIGWACASRLVAEGASVVLCARDPEALEHAAGELRAAGGRAVASPGSMEDAATADRAVAVALGELGRLDCIVNAVGGTRHRGPWEELDQVQLAETIGLNTWPALNLVQAALRRGFGHDGGSVVNVSSGSPRKTTPTLAAYSAGKSALEAMTRTLASDLAARRVRVNAVAPGLTRTLSTRRAWEHDGGASAGSRLPLGRITEPADVALAVAFLLSDDAAQITGVVLEVDGGNHLFGGGWTPYTTTPSNPGPGA